METEIIEAFNLKVGDTIVLPDKHVRLLSVTPMHSMDIDDNFEGIGVFGMIVNDGRLFRKTYDILDSVRIIKRKEQKNGD